MKNSVAFVHVGDARLKGEVLRVQDWRADPANLRGDPGGPRLLWHRSP